MVYFILLPIPINTKNHNALNPLKVVLFLCCFFYSFNYLTGQRCKIGQDFHNEQIREQLEAISKERLTAVKAQARSKFVIPIVIHVVWNKEEENIADEQIFSQLNALNRDFQLANIDTSIVPDLFKPLITNPNLAFELAATDPEGNPTTGITRTETNWENIGAPPLQGSSPLYYTEEGGKDAWNTDHYLNIWVAAMPINTSGIGFASRPGQRIPEEDGIIIDYRHFGTIGTAQSPYDLGRTLTHEVGHYFNLLHLSGDSSSDCSQDDMVQDTPFQSDNYSECEAEIPSTCDTDDMTNNFMNWVDDECMVMFTKGQVARMLLALTEARSGLINPSVSTHEVRETEVNDVLLQPNPAHHGLTLRLLNNNTTVPFYELVNLSGQILHSGQLAQTNTGLDVTSFPRGLYFINIYFKERKIVKKLMLY